jgi:hypothetical protein
MVRESRRYDRDACPINDHRGDLDNNNDQCVFYEDTITLSSIPSFDINTRSRYDITRQVASYANGGGSAGRGYYLA